jgi:hypothetical protein|tara:strand:+ start:641 stop:1021 length:381 start_codon:yes stop_codon:yes gene_type:complete
LELAAVKLYPRAVEKSAVTVAQWHGDGSIGMNQDHRPADDWTRKTFEDAHGFKRAEDSAFLWSLAVISAGSVILILISVALSSSARCICAVHRKSFFESCCAVQAMGAMLGYFVCLVAIMSVISRN